MPATTSRSTARRAPRRLRPHSLAHFEWFCRRFIVLDNGKPLILEAFQLEILRDFFEFGELRAELLDFQGTQETLVLLPKKNGKTTLLAALAIYHLIYTADAACYIAAAARDQAKIMYDQACGFVERKDPLTGQLLPQAQELQMRVVLKKGTKEIRSSRDNGFIWVLSGDKDTADGVIPTLALVDELHRHKDRGALYGVLADGLGPRNGQIFTISTAGESMRSALGRIRREADKLPHVERRDGVYTYARSSTTNGMPAAFVMHEYALGPKDDRRDLQVVKRANPLSTNTLEKLRARRDSPTMTPSRWARFACGLWVQGDDAAVSGVDWADCGIPGLTIKAGREIWLGIDVGWRWDTTAIVPMQIIDATRVRFGRPTILTPPRNGSSLPVETVVNAVLEFAETWQIAGVVFDRNAEGEFLAGELEKHGILVAEHSQDPAPMADSCMGLTEAIGHKLVEHPCDEEFSAHILAAKARTTAGERWRFVAPQQHRGQRKKGRQDGDDIEVIDAAIAAAMVHSVALANFNDAGDTTDKPAIEIWT
ncbi:MAG: terminase large subunit [Solirubrobacteraceae bacterium]|nr:terminase large subunit [Solirubrobacteraceae bacterium]